MFFNRLLLQSFCAQNTESYLTWLDVVRSLWYIRFLYWERTVWTGSFEVKLEGKGNTRMKDDDNMFGETLMFRACTACFADMLRGHAREQEERHFRAAGIARHLGVLNEKKSIWCRLVIFLLNNQVHIAIWTGLAFLVPGCSEFLFSAAKSSHQGGQPEANECNLWFKSKHSTRFSFGVVSEPNLGWQVQEVALLANEARCDQPMSISEREREKKNHK